MVEPGAFFQTFLGLLGVQLPWIVPALVAGVSSGSSPSATYICRRVTMVFEGASIVLLLVLAGIILARGGAHRLTPQPFA